MLKQMGHISDRTLDNLLDGTLDGASELAIEEHVRHCDRCAHRLREWELLFPQVKSLIPTGEHPVPGGSPVFAAPRAPAVYVPDWTPPRASRAVPVRFAWGLVVILALGAGYLVLQRTRVAPPSIGFLPETYDAAQQPTVDSAGLGSGIPTLTDTQLPSLDSARIHQASEIVRIGDSIANARMEARPGPAGRSSASASGPSTPGSRRRLRRRPPGTARRRCPPRSRRGTSRSWPGKASYRSRCPRC
jgi:hypothetical protein